MEKILSFVFILIVFTQCGENFGINREVDTKERGKSSIVGTISIDNLRDFHLQRDTALAEIDTLGYYTVSNPSGDNAKPVIENAEIFECKYANGCLRETTRFCKGQLTDSGFKVVLHGSPSRLFNRILSS